MNVDEAVRERYSGAARQREELLCCPVDYDRRYLEILPPEIIERDYGCGDPSRYVRPGETVLDLGSGGGKVCYIASQVVGEAGRVIGVDCNEDMLSLARKYQASIGDELGYHNVDFRKGRIQDLALDLEAFEAYLAEQPVRSSSDWLRAEEHADRLRREQPLVPADSVDVVVSNCVLNLVKKSHRRQLFAEIYRVLKRGGRAVISDITSDEPVPTHLQEDAALWSGCLSGAFVEDEFLQAFAQVGFYGIEILARRSEPWAVVEGIEFRSVTLQAFKGKDGPCLDRNQAVIYQGPWQSVTDDDGNVLRRGVRTAVCDKTFEIYNRPPYAGHVLPVEPHVNVPLAEAKDFDCRRNAVRTPAETKRQSAPRTQMPGTSLPMIASDCGPDCC